MNKITRRTFLKTVTIGLTLLSSGIKPISPNLLDWFIKKKTSFVYGIDPSKSISVGTVMAIDEQGNIRPARPYDNSVIGVLEKHVKAGEDVEIDLVAQWSLGKEDE